MNIEAQLQSHPSVEAARVLRRRTTKGDVALVAYVVPRGPFNEAALRAHLAASSAEEPAPDAIVALSVLPTDANGAWDEAALAAIPVIDDALTRTIEDRAREIWTAGDVVAVRDAVGPTTAPLAYAEFAAAEDRERAAEAEGAAAAGAAGRPAIADGGPLDLSSETLLLTAALQNACTRQDPDAIVVHRADGSVIHASYRDLSDAAKTMLVGLQERGVAPGSPIAIVSTDNWIFLQAFWACVLGGYVPVPIAPAPTYQDANAAVRRITAALSLLPADTPIVADGATAAELARCASVVGIGPEVVLDAAALRRSGAPRLHPARPEDVTLIMLTSGSTGMPKGVPLTHRNLMARAIASRRMNGFDADTVSLNWIPFDHVAGIIYFHLRDTHLACRQVHVDNAVVLSDPLKWLDLLEQHRATVTFAPNFAFGLLCERAEEIRRRRWDLSRLSHILNGGEAVVAATTRQCMKLLMPHGLRGDAMVPAWGMSETSSGITYNHDFRLETTADSDRHVSVGRPLPGDRLRIVDEDDRVVAEGVVGRLQAQGETVFGGYYGNATPREETFTADGWFRTGDLARIDDGRMTITGREKDMIIIGGVNYPSAMIEAVVEELDGIERSFTAACAVADPGGRAGECLAIFLVTTVEEQRARNALFRAVRERVVRMIGIAPTFIVPVARDDVPKTSIGKIQRRKLQELFAKGAFDGVASRVDSAVGVLPNWLLRPGWRPVALDAAHRTSARGTTIVVGSGALADAMIAASAAGGAVRAEPGAAFERHDASRFAIGPDIEEGLVGILEALHRDGRTVDRIVHLLDHPLCAAERRATGLADAVRAACAGRLRLVKAIARGASDHPGMRVAIVTGPARRIGDGEDGDPALAAAAALATSAAQEALGAEIASIEIDVGEPAAIAGAIDAELEHATLERDVAYRGGRRFLPCLRTVQPRTRRESTCAIRPRGVYLVTGGLGGAGQHVASHLLSAFRARVIIVGRGDASGRTDGDPAATRRAATLRALEALPGEVAYVQADIGDRTALRRAVEPILARWGGKLDGILHLAGTHRRTPTAAETEAGLDAVFRAKIDGTLALAALIDGHDDATFVVFSSQVALAGAAEQAAYAAANRFVDAFVERQAAAGRPFHALNWTAWRGTGMSSGLTGQSALHAIGLEELPPELAVQLLQVAFHQAPGRLAIGVNPDNPFVRRQLDRPVASQRVLLYLAGSGQEMPSAALPGATDPFGAPVPVVVNRVDALPRTADGAPDRERLSNGSTEEAARVVAPRDAEERVIADIWRSVIGIDEIDVESSLFELGGQSIVATRLAALLGEATGTTFTLRDIFEAPTIAGQAELVRQRRGAVPSAPAAAMAPAGAAPALSMAQRRIWFLDQLDPGHPVFNIPVAIRFESAPDVARVEWVLNRLVERHDALRARFPVIDGVPSQIIAERANVTLAAEELPPGESVESIAAAEGGRRFDIAGGPVFRFRLLHAGDGRHVLLFTLHHIVTDAWSMRVFFQEFVALYRDGKAARLPELAIAYGDIARWQAAQLDDDARARQIEHWRRRLAGNLRGFALPTDRQRPAVRSQSGARVTVAMSRECLAQVRAFGREHGGTLFTVLLAAFMGLLQRYAQNDDVVVGTAIANRDDPRVANVMSLLINLIVQRVDLSGDPTFAEALRRVQDGAIDAYAAHELPFEDLVDALQVERDTSRTPLFQVAFDLHDVQLTASTIPGISFEVVEIDLGTSQFDLHLIVKERADRLDAIWEYDTALFERETIERMAANFERLLAACVERPDTRLSRLPILAPAESRMLADWSSAPRDYPRGEVFHGLFEGHARRNPAAPALSFAGTTLTYGELDARSNRLARKLRELGVGPDRLVGLCLRRGLSVPIAALAVLKAGGAFLPLDPAYPPERLAFMVDDSGCDLVLSTSDLAAVPAARSPRRLDLDRVEPDLQAYDAGALGPIAGPSDLAYAIYTSGSTGRPKGVLVEHHGLCNLCHAQVELFGLGPGSRVLQFASFSFDASVFEYAMALGSGGTLCLGSEDEIVPGPSLSALLQRERVNAVVMPPTALLPMQPEDLPELKLLTVAGEACPQTVIDRWATPERRFFNLYGPTETTIWASYARCRAGESERPPIGRPVPNTRLYVLDRNRHMLPAGMPGELYIGGEGLARGYHNRPDLTASAFVPDPFADGGGGRMYRTGDLVRWLPDGQLDFLGRIDHQVKIRGFRIELGEIEAVLQEHPAVEAAVAAVRKDARGDDLLVAYVVPRDAGEATPEALRRFAEKRMPRHFVPNLIVPLAALPLTPSRKVDRAALPDPVALAGAGTGEGTAPRTAMEVLIAEVWCRVLEQPRIGTERNFFEVGGHSLKLAQVQTQLSQRLGRQIPMVSLFRYPTIATLAAHLADGAGEPARQPDAQSERKRSDARDRLARLAGRAASAQRRS